MKYRNSSDYLAIQLASHSDESWNKLMIWRDEKGINSDKLIALRTKGQRLIKQRLEESPELILANEIIKEQIH